MKSLSSLVLLTSIFIASCTKPNPCQSNQECTQGDVCNLESATCEASAEADSNPPADAPQAECDPTESICLSEIPEQWSGPLVQTVAPADEESPACAGTYDQALEVKFSDLQTSGSCDCECGTASGLDCTDATIQGWNGSDGSCETNVCDLVSGGGGGGGCVADAMQIPPESASSCSPLPVTIKNANRIRAASFGAVVGGSCASPTTEKSLDAAFAKQHVLCGAEQNTLCGSGESCAPVPEEPSQICIAQTGEHECPSGDFTERELVFSGFDDLRTCDAAGCSCSAPTGSCGGDINIRSGSEFSCGSVLDTLEPSSGPFAGSANLCDGTASSFNIQFLPNLSNRSCQAGGEGDVVGEVTGTGVTTVCCTTI
jgi:hypothetical protein